MGVSGRCCRFVVRINGGGIGCFHYHCKGCVGAYLQVCGKDWGGGVGGFYHHRDGVSGCCGRFVGRIGGRGGWHFIIIVMVYRGVVAGL